jgi:hypothetical protein
MQYLALPLGRSTLHVLIEHYTGAEFGWSIRQSSGVVAPILVISACCPMRTNLFADVFKLAVKLDHLRFQVSFEDAKEIISLRPHSLTEANILVLEQFCHVVELIQRQTGLRIGEPRNYAVLGQ